MRLILSAFLLVLATSFAMDGYAQKSDKKKAKIAFKKGIKLYNAGDSAEAVKQFRYADALNPSWKIKYNIGQCEASLKRYGLAIEAFEQYLGEGGDEIEVERRDEVLKELDRLRKMVGTITVTGEPGIDIYVESIKRGNTSVRTSIKVTAGVEHEITFMKGDEKLGSVKLLVSGGEVVALPTDTKRPTVVSVTNPEPTTTTEETTPAEEKTEPALTPSLYPNMRLIKEALKAGAVTRAQYKEYQQIIRKNRQIEYDKLKADYRARTITKREYKIGIRDVKKKYEGIE